jgi:hypothetical protein
MPLFPKIQSPCPYKDRLAEVMDGEYCRMCRRSVVDLTGFTSDERVAFLAGCEEEVCVSYRLPRAAVGAAALAAAALAVPTAAAAQDAPAVAAAPEAPVAEALAEVDAGSAYDESVMVMVGGIKDPRNVEFASIDEDSAVPELPVVYEDKAKVESGTAAPQGEPVRSRDAPAPL